MQRLLLAVVVVAFVGGAARADDAIPEEVLEAIKNATVLVKVEAGGESCSGSGFVTSVVGDSVYVVTNHHVIAPKLVSLVIQRRPGVRPVPRRPIGPHGPYVIPEPYPSVLTPRLIVTSLQNAAVTVVFRSGTKREQAVRAQALATDPERDLAILKAVNVKDPPIAIDFGHEPKLAETMPVYIFGFPFGAMLATSKGSPAITVGKGSISSLRRDDNGDLAVVQIDGALNPGNSGGPVVDVHGRLVGVAVATIKNSSGIGLAIPPGELTRMLWGRVGQLHLSIAEGDKGKTVIHVEVGLIDPLNKIRSVVLHYLAANQVKERPQPADPLGVLPGCHKLPLKIDGQVAVGEIPLHAGIEEVSIFCQAVYVNGADKTIATNSLVQTLRSKAADDRKVTIDSSGRATALPRGAGLSPQVPRPEKCNDGPCQVTSSTTRVRAQPVARGTAPLPKPAKCNASMAGKSFRSGSWEMVQLNVLSQKHGSFDRSRAPMVFAPDGRYFYLLDGQNTLHKIADDLTEDVSLDTGATCDDLSFSKAGLLVALNSAQAVWVVDPASLEVLREIPVKGLRHVAGSPATPIGFADGTASEDAEPSPRGAAQLSMIDFSKGACLHRIENRFGESGTNGSLVFDARGIFEGLLAMQMTREGKYLYLGGQEIKRFRLQGEDLFFEEASRSLRRGFTTHFVISGDGKFAAMPSGAGNAASYDIVVLDATRLDQQLLALENGAYPCAIGFDAKTGNIYSPNHEEMNIFSPRGGKLAQIVLKDNDVRRIAVHPGGERFLVWSEKKITYYRFVNESQAADEPKVAIDSSGPAARLPRDGGLSPQVPRLEKRKDGDCQVTSAATRVKVQPVAKSAAPLPRPAKRNLSMAGQSYRSGSWKMTELDVLFPKHGRRDGNRAPMVFAPDGRHFYLLDAQNTLHKIAGDLTEDVSLDTGAACDDLSFSKAGLLVALNSAQAVWVVDPASLEVLREIPVQGLRHVAGSPGTAIGFADGTAPEDAEPSPRAGAQLSMIDFSKGARLHQIVNRYRDNGTDGSPVFDGRATFGGSLAMQMTREGKYLYLGGQQIKRFRLEGEDLFFEEASRNPIYGRALRFVISDDGKFAPMPGGGNAAGFALAVLDAMHLDQQLLALDSGANSCVVGFDAKTGNIYSANRKEVDLFSPRGGRLAEIVLKDNDVRRIAVHPGGERFLAWGQKRITYCRFVDDEEKVDKSNHPAQ